MASSNVELPVDLVIEILLRLPVKSIIRFKSAVKTWHHLFKSPLFVSQHKKKNRNKNSHSIVVHYRDRNLEKSMAGMLLFADEKTLVSYRDLQQQLPHGFANKNCYGLIVEDGLVCLYAYYDMILWNPATNESRILPDYNQYIPRKHIYSFSYVGCGMDPLSNDYKVLFIRKYIHDFKIQCAVYNVSSDSWRVLKEEDVKIVDELDTIKPNIGHACVNGVYYWEVVPYLQSMECKVLAFNFSTEVFQVLASPFPGRIGTLIPLHDGRIAVWESMIQDRADPTYERVIWVLNDEGNWTKLISIDHLPSVLRIYGFWTHGKVFVQPQTQPQRPFLLYDLATKEFSEAGFETSSAYVYIYEESLLGVKRE